MKSKSRFGALFIALIIGCLIVIAGLGFLFGIDNPVSWVLILLVVLIPVVFNRFSKRNQLEWKESYSVGVKSLDDDHKKLIELLNHFQTAYDYNVGEEGERKALDELVAYTKYHFQREEELMEQNGYPSFAAHREQHQAMVADVGRFYQEYDRRGHDALGDVAKFLERWLIEHINGTDKQYGPFLNEKGIV